MLERLLNDWPLKLLALVMAFGIWVSITGQERTVRDFTLPVDVQLREDCIPAEPPPTTVTVRLEGPATSIRKLDPLRLSVRLDLRDDPPGEREVQLTEAHLGGVPRGVSVAFFNPDRVHLVVDSRLRRELKLLPNLVGRPPDGTYLYHSEVSPETVTVEGPESAVGPMAVLHTDPIPIDRRTRTFSATVRAVVDRPQVRIVDPRPVEVRVVLDATPVDVAFDDVPVVLEGDSFDSRSARDTLRVTLSGPPELLRRIVPAQIRATADVSELEPQARSQRVGVRAEIVDLPPDQLRLVRVKAVEPSEVSVLIAPRGGEAS